MYFVYFAVTKIQTNYYRTNFFLRKIYEKHRGGASRQGARSPQERLPTQYVIPLATANIVTEFTVCQRLGIHRPRTLR